MVSSSTIADSEEPSQCSRDLCRAHREEDGGTDDPPARPQEELLEELLEAIEFVCSFLASKNFRLRDIIEATGFERNATIVSAKEIINENDETRKRFEIMARTVFRKFKACLNVKDVNDHRWAYDAINIVYKSLREDREQADISQIIMELHSVVSENIKFPKHSASGRFGLRMTSRL